MSAGVRSLASIGSRVELIALPTGAGVNSLSTPGQYIFRPLTVLLCTSLANYLIGRENHEFFDAGVHEEFALSPATVIWHTLFRPTWR